MPKGFPKPEELIPSYRFESRAKKLGATRIAGIDEAGRGPLAGPVLAAAVILNRRRHISEINDSKLLTPAQRESLYKEIMSKAVAVAVGACSSNVIDEINIYQATRRAMLEAVKQILPTPDYLLVDGNLKLDCEIPQEAVVKGDRLSFSVAAAGIVAKVTRDRIMLEFHDQYPHYGFANHKGYATRTHLEALCEHGPCPIHRIFFKGVRPEENLSLF